MQQALKQSGSFRPELIDFYLSSQPTGIRLHFFSLAGDAKRNQGIRLRLRWLIPDGVKKRRVKTRRFGGMDHGKEGFAFLLYRFESQDSWRNLLFYNKR